MENNNNPLRDPNHWKQIEQESKLNFYECAMHFFTTNDILSMVEVLQNAKSEDKDVQGQIDKNAAGLKSLWLRHHLHSQDLNDIVDKRIKCNV